MTINSFDTPDQLTDSIIKQAKALNYIGAGRYISGGGLWKHLTATEVVLCKQNNFGLFLIDEGAGNKAQFQSGMNGGLVAGKAAAKVANQLGVPSGIPIFVGVDFDADETDVDNIHDYMVGYASGCVPYKAGMYADGLIASKVPTSVGDFVPGASGWEGTADYLKSGKVSLIQHPPINKFGIDTDPVEVVDASVLWFQGTTVQVVPQPTLPMPTPSTDRVIAAIKNLQTELKNLGLYSGAIDGIWGPLSEKAVEQV